MMRKKVIAILKAIYNVCYPHHKLRQYNNYLLTKADLDNNQAFIAKMNARLSQSMDIHSCLWFLPGFGNIHAGGASTIFKIADKLSKQNQCLNYFVFEQDVPENWKSILSASYPDMKFEILINDCNTRGVAALPDSDIAICTFWKTAFSLVKYNSCRKKLYLLQDDERLFYPSGSDSTLVEATYYFGFIGLANSVSIQESYSKKSLAKTLHYVPGITSDFLKIDDYLPSEGRFNIVAYARPSHSRNSFELIAKVLSDLADEYKDLLNIFLVGESFNPKDYKLSSRIIVKGNVTDAKQTHELYADCDMGISLITTPTVSYQQLDMLAAGRCLMAFKNGEIENLFSADEVCFTSPFPEVMKNDIVNLINNRAAVKSYADKGRQAAKNLNWDITLEEISHFIAHV